MEHGSLRTRARFSENQSTVLQEPEHGSLRIRAHLSWRTGKHLHVLHVLRTYSTCSELTPRAPIPDGRMERFMHPCFALWHIVAYCYALWNIVAHSGISWLTVDYCGIRWNIVVHWGILWRTLEYCGTLLLWHIVRTRSCKVSLVCFCGDVVLLKRIHLPSEGIATLLTKCNTMVFFVYSQFRCFQKSSL